MRERESRRKTGQRKQPTAQQGTAAPAPRQQKQQRKQPQSRQTHESHSANRQRGKHRDSSRDTASKQQSRQQDDGNKMRMTRANERRTPRPTATHAPTPRRPGPGRQSRTRDLGTPTRHRQPTGTRQEQKAAREPTTTPIPQTTRSNHFTGSVPRRDVAFTSAPRPMVKKHTFYCHNGAGRGPHR